ncbi:MAG TPA: hypothetical protein VKI23_05200 [Cellulomonadaceae bacterium]|nr:hypothetical protein [Cellulomonadaceae bacterium]
MARSIRSRQSELLLAEYTATFGSTWRPVTRRKHTDDYARLIAWLEANELPVTTASLDFMTLVDYVGYLWVRPKVSGVWRGGPDAPARSRRHAPVQTLSANSVNAYVAPCAHWRSGSSTRASLG